MDTFLFNERSSGKFYKNDMINFIFVIGNITKIKFLKKRKKTKKKIFRNFNFVIFPMANIKLIISCL